MESLSSETERLHWRRKKVLELSSEGRSQPQIAKILQVGLATVNRDLQYLRQEAKENIKKIHRRQATLRVSKMSVGLDRFWARHGILLITKSPQRRIGYKPFQLGCRLTA